MADFDVPDEFVMPIWDIELKIPLVQTRYEMTDISNQLEYFQLMIL